MKKLDQIPIIINIKYKSSEYDPISGWPLIRIIYDDKIIKNFEADDLEAEFQIEQNLTDEYSTLKIEHYGKNYHSDKKFFEIEKVWINNIDIEHILWESYQYPILPPWDDKSQEQTFQKGNMFLGHNGYIVWRFKNPIILDLKDRLGKSVSQIEGQETTWEVLNSVKSYFFNIKDD